MSAESLLLAPATRVTCPKCAYEFSLEQGFAKQALEGIEAASYQSLESVREQERQAVQQWAQKIAGEQSKSVQRQAEDLTRLLKEQSDTHAKAIAEMRAVTEQAFMPQLDALKAQLTDSQTKLTAVDQREAVLNAREQSIESQVAAAAAERAAKLVAGERQTYEKRLSEQSGQLQLLRAEQLALREERQKLKDDKDGLALEVHRQLDAKLAEREVAVRAQEQERTGLEKAELQKKLDDLSSQFAAAQRKLAVGSQQLQGEVLELAVEEGLRRTFPLDTIDEVKKGVRGGDVIQRVVSHTGQPAGIILWETKRAKDWQASWVSKLKEDMRACGAEIGILVTVPTVVPKTWVPGQVFGLHEDVWVTDWALALQLADVLRTGMLDLHKQRLVSSGKGEKMEAVYDYLTSPQFAQKLKAVYGTFQALQEDLAKERAITEQRFARREKQIGIGIKELLGFAGNVQGLAQQELPALELTSLEGQIP